MREGFAGTNALSACKLVLPSLTLTSAQGAPNIDEFLPDKEAIIDYRALGSPAALRAELLRLGSDAAAWNAKVGPCAGCLCMWTKTASKTLTIYDICLI